MPAGSEVNLLNAGSSTHRPEEGPDDHEHGGTERRPRHQVRGAERASATRPSTASAVRPAPIAVDTATSRTHSAQLLVDSP